MWAICTWLSKNVLEPIIVSLKDPLSIVQFAPTSTPFSNIAFPIWGVLWFFCEDGMKPKPLKPILDPSWICTSLDIKEFLIVTNEPIVQFSPTSTLLSIILLLPTIVFIWYCLPVSLSYGYHYASDTFSFAPLGLPF